MASGTRHVYYGANFTICSTISCALSGLYYHLYQEFEPRTYALSILFSPLVNVLFAFLAAATIHPFVRLTQGLGNAGFEATFHVMCYSPVVLLLDWAFTSGPGMILYLFLALFPWLPALVVVGVTVSLVLQLGGGEFVRDAERVLDLIGVL